MPSPSYVPPSHIAIHGVGPVGYVATIRAAQHGALVTVVERQAVGGVALNRYRSSAKAWQSVFGLGVSLAGGLVEDAKWMAIYQLRGRL